MAAPFSSTAGAKPGTNVGGMLWGTPGMDTAATDATPRGLSCVGPFAKANLATNTAHFLNPSSLAAVSQITMPKGGSLLGWTCNLDAAPATGSGTLTVFKNGTAGGGIFTSQTISALTDKVFTTNLSSLTFNEGDSFKVRITTSTDFTNTTDAVVFLWTT